MTEESLSSELITEGLRTRIIGRKLLYYPSVTSTNDLAKRLAEQGEPEGTVVIAGEQTAGRGRLKRAWLTPGGNIAVSVILRPEISLLPRMIMLASVAVVRAVSPAAGLKAGIKWPNDVLINGKKVCGILIENDVRKEAVNYSVIGIGINIAVSPADSPEIRYPATSLAAEAGKAVSRLELVRKLLKEMDGLYTEMPAGESVFEEWRDNLVTLGTGVKVTAGDTVYEGVAESVSEDGSLRLRLPGGGLVTVVAGDVTLRGQSR
jgi:BirA family biotin operon repressor/biotin-[acetyl-CoA-carboxylase] ligase